MPKLTGEKSNRCLGQISLPRAGVVYSLILPVITEPTTLPASRSVCCWGCRCVPCCRTPGTARFVTFSSGCGCRASKTTPSCIITLAMMPGKWHWKAQSRSRYPNINGFLWIIRVGLTSFTEYKWYLSAHVCAVGQTRNDFYRSDDGRISPTQTIRSDYE